MPTPGFELFDVLVKMNKDFLNFYLFIEFLFPPSHSNRGRGDGILVVRCNHLLIRYD